MNFDRILHSFRIWILSGFMLLAGGWFLSKWTPSDQAQYSICFLRQTTGIPCPGCGLTRGFAALMKLDLSGAVHQHPLSPLIGLEVCLAWIWWGLVAARNTKIPGALVVNRFLILQAGLLVVVWGYRMVAIVT